MPFVHRPSGSSRTMYLLDANVLIDANRDYYPISRVPEYWEWLEYQATVGQVKAPLEVWEEIKAGKDDVADWLKQDGVAKALLLAHDADVQTVSLVVAQGYAGDLTDDELIKIGADPFLIAYAVASAEECVVVTTEVSKPNATRANRKIPDVCEHFGVPCCNPFQFGHQLNFSTDWRASLG